MPLKSTLIDQHLLATVTGLAAGLALSIVGCTQPSLPDFGTPIPTHPQTKTTATPRITPHSATAAATPETTIDVPSWLIDPDASIMMTKTRKFDAQLRESEYGVAVFNASTGERFDLPWKDIVAYFWMPDGKRFGILLDNNSDGLYLVDSTSGRITRYPLAESVTKHASYGGEPTPLIPSGTDVAAPDFLLFNPSGRSFFYYEISADRRYKAWPDYAGDGRSVTMIEDLQTGQKIQVPQDEGLNDGYPVWSPIDNLLAVVQATEPWVPNYPPPGKRTLRIYDISTDEFLASSPGDFGAVVWSPDGTRILYGTEQPCILEWEKKHSWCLDDGRSFHGGEQVISYDWSPDDSWISYIYFSYPSFGGLCIKRLIDGELRCPTMDIPELADGFVRKYRWSPDGRYLLFASDTDSCPGCDYSTDPQIGIIDVNKGTYWYPLEGFDFDTPDLAVWRPEIPSQ